MAFSGGVYTLPTPALVPGQTVSSSENNTVRNDMAASFNLTMLRNGTSTATANLPMGGYKLTGLGVATTSGDALSYGQAAVISDITVSGSVTISSGTANGVAYLNGSKVLTTGSLVTFDGSQTFKLTSTSGPLFAVSDNVTTFGYIGSQSAITGAGAIDTFIVTSANSKPLNLRAPSGQYISFDASGSEQMRLTSTGLGIGTSSITRKLTVLGSGVFTDGTNDVTIWNDGSIGTNASVNLKLLTGGSTKATLDTSGNLGLGVTPSAWNSDRVAIQLATGATINGSKSSGNLVEVGGNFYLSSGGSDTYKYSDVATKYRQYGGVHSWYTAPSGTAGNAITFTQAMTLDASGNLGIGTSSPNSAGVNRAVTISGAATSILELNAGSTRAGYLYANTSATILSAVQASSILQFNTVDTERMRIDSSGNVLVGGTSVTPFAGTTGLGVQRATTPAIYLSQTQNTGGYTARDYVNYVTANAALAWYDTTASLERMRIDSSGNVGIGTTTSLSRLTALGSSSTVANGASTRNPIASIRGGNDNNRLDVYVDNSGAATIMGLGAYNTAGAGTALAFYTGASVDERMRIDSSGNLLVGTTTTRDAIVVAAGKTAGYSYRSDAASTSGTYYHFTFNPAGGTQAGFISSSTTTTTYSTSSDYRLKENIQPMQNALAVVQQLNPVTYTWKADGSDGQGFIAHELQAVVPDCVTGEKDAVDEEGNPVYQGIDTSFLVATLTKAIQELEARVKQLEGK